MILAFGSAAIAQDARRALMEHAVALGHEVKDFGSDDPMYPHTAIAVANEVVSGASDRGVVVCGTGVGVAIAANKVKGAHCALVTDVFQAEKAQPINNANMIAIGSQVTGIESAKCLLTAFLSNTFDPESQAAVKVAAITTYEEQN